MDKPIFEAGQEYRTRGGLRARVYATDGLATSPIHGAVQYEDGGFRLMSWRADGRHAAIGFNGYDLMPPSRDWLAEIDACKPYDCDTWGDWGQKTRRIVEILMDFAKTQVKP